MKTSAVLVSLAALAAAQPHRHHARHAAAVELAERGERTHTETAWVTDWVRVTKLIDATTTQFITVSPTPESFSASFSAHRTHSHSSQGAEFYESKSAATHKAAAHTTALTTLTSVIVPATTPTTPTPVAEPTTVATEPAVEAATSIVQQAAAVAPTTVQQAAYTPTTAAAAVATTATTSTSSTSGSTNSGDITYYDIGLGACGTNNAGDDYDVAIVALSSDLMGAASNDNDKCGLTITISANGKTTTALVADKCEGCAYSSIDVSKKVFVDLWGGLDKGRGTCEWWFN